MWFAQALKLRDKLSRKRNILLADEEKPFLEHLEDLRKMIMRIVITLLVSVTLCFTFNSWFFEIVQYPMARAGLASAMEKNRPDGISMDNWMSIHSAARGAAVLEGGLRQSFLNKALPDPKLRPYADAFLIYHATSLLSKDLREGFMEEVVKTLPAENSAAVLAAAQAMDKAGPSPSLEELKPVIENVAMAPAETFMLSMKLSTFAGVIVAFPLLFYFILEFILPGLNVRERRLMWPALTIAFGLFLFGVVFSYFFVVPNALEFFHSYSSDLNVKDTWRIGMYISFVVTFSLIFGVSFELPVVVMILVKLDLLTAAAMRRTRSWAIIIIVVAGAILTPTGDPLTLCLLSGPMVIMYEICIWLAVAREKKNSREEAEEQNRDMARRAALVGVASVTAPKPGSVQPDENIYTREDDGHQQGHDHGLDHYPHGDDDHYHHSGDGSAHYRGEFKPGDGSGDANSGLTEHGPDGSTVKPSEEESWRANPHHPDPEKPTAEEEREQYLREHAHLYPPVDTHPESIPVEERHSQGPPAPEPESPARPDENAATDSVVETPESQELTPENANADGGENEIRESIPEKVSTEESRPENSQPEQSQPENSRLEDPEPDKPKPDVPKPHEPKSGD